MSEGLYNTLEEALLSESVFSLLSSCNDIAIVVYDSDNLRSVEFLSDFFYDNNLELTAVKELIIHGKNRIAIRKKTADISSDYIVPKMTYTGLAGKEMYNCSFLKRMLYIHMMPEDVKKEHISLIERNRYMYQLLISDKKDKVGIKVNVSLRNLHCQKTKNPKRVLKYCKDRRAYLQKLIDSNYFRAAFDQCVQECRNGCEECPHATTYGQEKSCPFFQLQMAKFYEHGWYVPQNDKIAHFWKVKAARQGIYEANIELANDYVHGKGCQQDIEKAISILMPLADSGYTLASNALIDIASSHSGYISPVPLIARLANRGDIDMIEKMISIYSKGEMDEKPDPTKCEEWVVLAAEKGCVKYVESLAQQYEEVNDWDNATRWYLKLQELNPEMDLAAKIDELFISKCQRLTSDELILKGNKSYYGYECEQDYHTAFLYYKLASERGCADGMFGLANCYSLGRGVEQDESKGLSLYESAAMNSSVDAIIKKLELLRESKQDSELTLWKDRLRNAFLVGEEKSDPKILRLIADEYRYNDNGIYDRDYDKAYHYYNKAMSLGDYLAIRMVGLCYCEGRGVKRNYSKAKEYFLNAAEKGVAAAFHCLGCMYSAGKGVDSDPIEGYNYYLKAAQKGLLKSQVEIAYKLHRGIGIEKNESERVFWLEQAAIQGDKASQCTLGELYYWGKDVPKDYKKSRFWTEKAALNNYSSAYFRYAYLCCEGLGGKVDYDSALKFYRLLPKESGAVNNLGYMYENGMGVPTDLVKAFELFKEAAEMGDEHSMRVLATKYYHGEGCAKDVAMAIQWYEKALDEGNMEAGFKLGDIYLNGKEVDEDVDIAMRYYEKAIDLIPKEDTELEDIYVKRVLKVAKLYYEGDKVEMNDERANKLYHIAAEYGDPEAYYMLGMQYYYGYGVTKDVETAIYWFRKAADKNYAQAVKFLTDNEIEWLHDDVDNDLPF